VTVHVPVTPGNCPALVLNADFRPLSYYPLSIWCWQDAIKAVFLDRVNIISEYETLVRSPSFEMRLPSVVSLKSYVKPTRFPAFTRFNVFLRDRFTCQYCGEREDLTFDQLRPVHPGGEELLREAPKVLGPRVSNDHHLSAHEQVKEHLGGLASERPLRVVLLRPRVVLELAELARSGAQLIQQILPESRVMG